MNYTFKNSSIVSVNSGTIVLNVSGKTRTFADAKLASVVDGKIVLDLPEASFKKGTYLTLVSNQEIERIFIFSVNAYPKICYYVSTHLLGGLSYADFWFKGSNNFRNATPEEIQELDDQLAAEGKRWNPDTMQIEKLIWKPKVDESYFTITTSIGNLGITRYMWADDLLDTNLYKLGNCFKTKKEAQAKLEQIKKLLLEV